MSTRRTQEAIDRGTEPCRDNETGDNEKGDNEKGGYKPWGRLSIGAGGGCWS